MEDVRSNRSKLKLREALSALGSAASGASSKIRGRRATAVIVDDAGAVKRPLRLKPLVRRMEAQPRRPSKYRPHQGAQECARRRRQLASAAKAGSRA